MVDGFAALLKRHGIQLTKGQPGTHARLGRLDRYHGTIRRQLGEIFAIRTSHVWWTCVDNHNTSPSRALDAAGKGTAPIDVARSATKEEMLRTADNKRAGGPQGGGRHEDHVRHSGVAAHSAAYAHPSLLRRRRSRGLLSSTR